MKSAKFIFKFNNHILPDSFNRYFTKFENVHKYNTKQTQRNKFFQFRISFESGKKLYIQVKFLHCPFSTLRKVTIYLLTSCNTEERIAQNIYKLFIIQIEIIKN